LCTLFLFINQIKDIPILIISNRDEYKKRKSNQINGWNRDLQFYANDIIAPRDEHKKGTWFACQNKFNPKWAILTNIRYLKSYKEDLKSRGEIILDFLNSNNSAENYLNRLKKIAHEYNYFNLIFSDGEFIYYYHSKDHESKLLYKTGDNTKKLFGLSNGKLDSNWPKIKNTKKTFLTFLNHQNNKLKTFDDCWDYFKTEMSNNKTYDIADLPNTGVPPEHEVFLSSLFISSEIYGTNSTLLFGIQSDSSLHFHEQKYDINSKMDSSKKMNIKFYTNE
jgi:uncharacterized protein with NRDE domain